MLEFIGVIFIIFIILGILCTKEAKMRKTTTRTKEVWSACGCGGKENCYLCKGTGKFLSETLTETIIEETQEKEDIVEAEEVKPELEYKE